MQGCASDINVATNRPGGWRSGAARGAAKAGGKERSGGESDAAAGHAAKRRRLQTITREPGRKAPQALEQAPRERPAGPRGQGREAAARARQHQMTLRARWARSWGRRQHGKSSSLSHVGGEPRERTRCTTPTRRQKAPHAPSKARQHSPAAGGAPRRRGQSSRCPAGSPIRQRAAERPEQIAHGVSWCAMTRRADGGGRL